MAKTTGKTHTATFTKEKETKNSVRYQEQPAEGVAPMIGSLYVQKHIAGDSEEIEVTVKLK